MSPTLFKADLRITNHRRQKSPPSFTLLSFKNRSKRFFDLNHNFSEGNVQAFRLTGLLRWQKLTWFSSIFFKICRFRSSILPSLYVIRCNSAFIQRGAALESGLTVARFFTTNHNPLLRIGTNEIASFWINRSRQMAFFRAKAAFRYYIKQIDSMLPCVWFTNRSQKTSKCGKNITDTLGYASCATFLFLPHFDIICDLLLKGRSATWNLFVK